MRPRRERIKLKAVGERRWYAFSDLRFEKFPFADLLAADCARFCAENCFLLRSKIVLDAEQRLLAGEFGEVESARNCSRVTGHLNAPRH
jgi:hypothetical protein